jgi:hypothetical protein
MLGIYFEIPAQHAPLELIEQHFVGDAMVLRENFALPTGYLYKTSKKFTI